MRIQRVLCPTDLSGGSLAALHRAAALARRHGAELHVLHAAPDIVELPLPADAAAAPGSPEALRAWLSGADLAGVAPRIATGLGDPTSAIVDYANAEAIDLIVMGTHGRTGIDRLRRGSIAARVRACTAAPVLTVPMRDITPDDASLAQPTQPTQLAQLVQLVQLVQTAAPAHTQTSAAAQAQTSADAQAPAHAQAPSQSSQSSQQSQPMAQALRPFTRVLCAVNLSAGSRAAVTLAQWFAQEHDAELMLLHIVDRLSPDEIVDTGYSRLAEEVRDRQERAAARLRALVPHHARMSGQAHERVEMGAPAESILDVAREWNADLIVLGAEERSRLSSLLLGSTTRTIVACANAPVLTATPATSMSWRPARDYLAAGRGVH